MEYSMTSREIRQFYNNRYTKNCSGNPFSYTKDHVDMNVMKMSVREWGTPKLRAHLVQTKAKKDIEVLGGIDGNFVALHFVCKGETMVENTSSAGEMEQNTNNLFITGREVKHTFRQGEFNSYFKILLSHDYMISAAEQYPDVFGTLLIMAQNGCPFLFDRNLMTTLEMKSVIEQIKNASDMGNLAPVYFETKVRELLILQLCQIHKFNYPECKYCKHYQEQLNEARNIIENEYQSPLTISQIAQHVGMSETVLKMNFKKCFGMTIYGYLFNYRMGIAKRLLGNKSMTIAEVGYKSGYEYPSHFTTAFKRKYGVSPIEYRCK